MVAQSSIVRPKIEETNRVPARPAFTVLELLVVIVVVGILSALLLSAVVQARAAARLATCQNNSRQIGIAFAAASDANGGFPTGRGYLKEIYPFSDAANLKQAIESPSGLLRDGGFPSPSWLICPNDHIANPTWGDTNYLQSDGVSMSLVGQRGRGVYRFGAKRTAINQINDGLSNTILVSERLVDPYFYPDIPEARTRDGYVRKRARRYHFWFPESIPVYDKLEPFVAECQLVNVAESKWYPIDNNPLLSRLWHQCSIGFNHVGPPNSNSCYLGDRLTAEPINPSVTGSTPATSLHLDCVVALLCDGSVRTVSNSVDANLWRAVGTIDGNEASTTF